MAAKADPAFPFQGRPKMIYLDNGPVAKSRVFNHGAIVTKWPMGIHAFDKKVSEVNLVTHATTAHAEMAVFSPWSD